MLLLGTAALGMNATAGTTASAAMRIQVLLKMELRWEKGGTIKLRHTQSGPGSGPPICNALRVENLMPIECNHLCEMH